MAYLIPASYTGMSSRAAHLRRNPPSGEPGTDYYMPTGTPLRAPTRCRVVHIGGSVVPATGRFVTLDDGTRWLRFLHLLEWRCKVNDELDPGEVFGISGASGYGSEYFGEPNRNAAFWRNTGGDHVHVTAFRGRGYTFGSAGTVDFHAMTGGSVAGTRFEEDTMTPAQEAKLDAKLDAVLTALGAHGLTSGGWTDTIMGNTRDLKAQVNGLPDALAAIMAQVNGVPTVLADIRKAIGTSGAPVDVDALAARIRAAVGDEIAAKVADVLAERLKS